MANYTITGTNPNGYTTDYPQTVAPLSYDLTSLTQSQLSVTHSFNRTVSDKGGQRFKIVFDYAPLPRDKFTEIWAFLIKQRGRFGRFTIALPNQEPRGSLATATGQQLKIKTAVEKGNQITIKNFQANQTGVIKAGDYFCIGTNSKTYIACQDYNSDANGEATITTYPNLTNSTSVDDLVYFKPVFTVSLINDELTCNVPNTNNANFSVEFIESVSNSGTNIY
jgi:hypothetical protein